MTRDEENISNAHRVHRERICMHFKVCAVRSALANQPFYKVSICEISFELRLNKESNFKSIYVKLVKPVGSMLSVYILKRGLGSVSAVVGPAFRILSLGCPGLCVG